MFSYYSNLVSQICYLREFSYIITIYIISDFFVHKKTNKCCCTEKFTGGFAGKNLCHLFSKMKKKWQHEITIEVPAWFFYVDYFHFYLYHLLKIEVKKKTFGGACFNICDV